MPSKQVVISLYKNINNILDNVIAILNDKITQLNGQKIDYNTSKKLNDMINDEMIDYSIQEIVKQSLDIFESQISNFEKTHLINQMIIKIKKEIMLNKDVIESIMNEKVTIDNNFK
jgi:hypothetical protein